MVPIRERAWQLHEKEKKQEEYTQEINKRKWELQKEQIRLNSVKNLYQIELKKKQVMIIRFDLSY